jgi:uncharacterized membrane protein YhaH (DUF805 family)
MRSFLGSKTRMPRLDRLLWALSVLWFAASFASLLLPFKQAAQIVTFLALTSVIVVLSVGAFSVRRGHPGAKYFLLAWSAFVFGVAVQVLHNNGLLPSTLFTSHAVLIGSALEMVLLSFALADHINVTRREKEAAQAQVLLEQAIVTTNAKILA